MCVSLFLHVCCSSVQCMTGDLQKGKIKLVPLCHILSQTLHSLVMYRCRGFTRRFWDIRVQQRIQNKILRIRLRFCKMYNSSSAPTQHHLTLYTLPHLERVNYSKCQSQLKCFHLITHYLTGYESVHSEILQPVLYQMFFLCFKTDYNKGYCYDAVSASLLVLSMCRVLVRFMKFIVQDCYITDNTVIQPHSCRFQKHASFLTWLFKENQMTKECNLIKSKIHHNN